MRASLPQTLRRQRRSRDGRHPLRAPAKPTPAPAKSHVVALAEVADPAAQRVREAGGPLDEASYACHCGFVFRAAVSTTVACPHCHAPQAW